MIRSCQKEDGTDDLKKGTQLLEIYALEIQMYTEQKNNKRLKELYQVGQVVGVGWGWLGARDGCGGGWRWVEVADG